MAQAATQFHNAEAQLPVIELNRAQLLHAIATLCGQSPVDFAVATNAGALATVPGIPASLPGELLEHRPDIAAAERRMAAANADVGVAKTAFFPSCPAQRCCWVPIRGFQHLVRLAEPFLGRRAIHSTAACSPEDSIARNWLPRAPLTMKPWPDYRQTVLNAFAEVEDALAAQRLLAAEWNAENEAMLAARRALEIANNRYDAGLVTYLDVATAQTTALNNEKHGRPTGGQPARHRRQPHQGPRLRLAGNEWNYGRKTFTVRCVTPCAPLLV